jgi:hypothetical protein
MLHWEPPGACAFIRVSVVTKYDAVEQSAGAAGALGHVVGQPALKPTEWASRGARLSEACWSAHGVRRRQAQHE